MSWGDRIITAIVEGRLVSILPDEDRVPQDGHVIVWGVNCIDQLDALVEEFITEAIEARRKPKEVNTHA